MYSQRTSSYVTLYSLARFTSLKSATADNFVPVTLCYHPPKLGLIESRIGQPNNTFPGHCDVLETMILKTIKTLDRLPFPYTAFTASLETTCSFSSHLAIVVRCAQIVIPRVAQQTWHVEHSGEAR